MRPPIVKLFASTATFALTATLSACDSNKSGVPPSGYILLRNSDTSSGDPVEVARFATPGESSEFNRENCTMTARIWNADLNASEGTGANEARQKWGFWCEAPDAPAPTNVPITFDAAFPAKCEASEMAAGRCW